MKSISASALSFEQALAQVLGEANPLPAETVTFAEAAASAGSAGRVLAEPLVAEWDDPPHPKSAMDGFAVVASHTQGASPDRPLVFQYRDVIGAGLVPNGTLSIFPPARVSDPALPAVRIMTGALLPAGADAVVKLEDTRADREATAAPEQARSFYLHRPLAPGENVIPPGARMARGETLLAAGDALGPQALGVLAATLRPGIRLVRRPVVALLALGNELVDVGGTLGLGQVALTNLHAISALVGRYGGTAQPLGTAPDDPGRIRELLAPCLGAGAGDKESIQSSGEAPRDIRRAPCDVVLTLGGSHRGDFDFAHGVLSGLGAQVRFDRVRMTPGGSTIFATHGRTLLFGLPGSPGASWSAFETLVRPALWKLAGRRKFELPRIMARLAAPVPDPRGRFQFVPCRLELGGRDPVAHPIEGRHPQETPVSPRADGLIRCPEEAPLPTPGAWVAVEWLAD